MRQKRAEQNVSIRLANHGQGTAPVHASRGSYGGPSACHEQRVRTETVAMALPMARLFATADKHAGAVFAALLGMGIALAGCGHSEPTHLAFDGPPAGALVAEDGRLLPPELRIGPDPRTLEPAGRWSLPQEVRQQLPGGRYLELRDTETGQSKLEAAVLPGGALPCWRVELRMPQTTQGLAATIRYVAGPRGSKHAVVRWDGQEERRGIAPSKLAKGERNVN